MSKALPPRPDLEHLKKQAKRLLDDAREGLASALVRFEEHHPREFDADAATLADAQLVLAREYGFSSWARFKNHVEHLAKAPAAAPAPEGLRELFAAIEKGEAARAQALLERRPGLALVHEARFNQSPLHLAARYDRPGIAKQLLEHGAELEARDGQGGTPLHTAVGWNRIATTRFLVEAGADVQACDARGRSLADKPLYYKDCAEVVEFVLARGVEPTWWSDLALERVTDVRARCAKEPALLQARYRIGGFVEIGVLHFAALRDSARMTDLLVELGADLHAQDEKGRTPADLALNMGHRAAYERLLAHGARAEAKLLERVGSVARVEAMRRLHGALVAGDFPVVKEILEADRGLLNTRFTDLWGTGGTFGAAPLHWAAMFNHLEICRYLLDLGADLELRDETYNATALGWAREYERDEAAALLEQRGALR
ncbi:MAG: ankyrin repeat domain-containing protein [Planctomycetota bacterium]|nr:ankyrin repeat domain-containing protein [Planctomycetota bacterium]